jgi:1-pyrroline-5-carboxylate dehydrogenase
LAVLAKADNTDLAEKAMKAHSQLLKAWKNTCPKERARYLLKAAAIMRRRKHELSAWMILEIGKSWAEADGDVAEAIDFCDFYAREMLRLGEPQPVTP